MTTNIAVSFNIKTVAFERLHTWQNNTYIKQIEEDKSARVQHHSCPDSEADHKLLRPLTFTLIKDPPALLNFFSPFIASLCEGGILWHGLLSL